MYVLSTRYAFQASDSLVPVGNRDYTQEPFVPVDKVYAEVVTSTRQETKPTIPTLKAEQLNNEPSTTDPLVYTNIGNECVELRRRLECKCKSHTIIRRWTQHRYLK